MEKIVEVVTLTAPDGRKAVFEITEDAEKYTGRRACVRGTSLYYEMPVFEKGVLKAVAVERVPA